MVESEMTPEEADVNKAIGPLNFVVVEKDANKVSLLKAMKWEIVALSMQGGVLMHKVCGQC